MASQKQAHTVSGAPSNGTGMRLRDTPSIRKSKRSTRENSVDLNLDIESDGKLTRENDAVALLLGLAHSLGSPASLNDTKEDTERRKGATKRSHESIDEGMRIESDEAERVSKSQQIDPRVMELLTAKGHGRLCPGDTRVRPPKAATKLLNAKWRHIRLPNIQAALEAEDWVVMYGHLLNPRALSKSKMKTMLNIHPSHYDDMAIYKVLTSLSNANELEHFLKDRYGVGAQKKTRTNQKVLPTGKVARKEDVGFTGIGKNIPDTHSMQNLKSPSNSMPSQFGSIEAVKSGVPLYENSIIRSASQDAKKNKGEEGSKISNERYSFPAPSGPRIGSASVQAQSLPIISYGGLSWPMLQNPSTVADFSKNSELSRNISQNSRSMPTKFGQNTRPNQQSRTVDDLSQNVQRQVDAIQRGKSQISNENEMQVPVSNGGVPSEDQDQHSLEGGLYKAGRPPSYDAMVRWCADLKRILFQKKVNLTIDEAIALVNDSSFYACGPKTAHTKSLVASTLRKRVLGIYGITWSQIATTADKDVNKNINDKAILFAATNMLKRHGLNSDGRLSSDTDKQDSLALSENTHAVKDTSKQELLEHSKLQMEPKSENSVPRHDQHLTTCDDVNNSTPMVTSCLHKNLAGISDTVKDIIKKAETQFLNFEEAAIIIKEAAQGKLPVSLQVNYRPDSGTLYLINRSKVAKFRCDGYEFSKRETHAKKTLKCNERLNCYYAGGTNDTMQRRCYWMISDDCSTAEDPYGTQPKDLVLIHYMKNCPWSDPSNPGDMPSKEDLMKQKQELEQKIAKLNQLLRH